MTAEDFVAYGFTGLIIACLIGVAICALTLVATVVWFAIQTMRGKP